MQLQDSTVLVTGGAGLVGSHLAERFLEDGATVRVVDDLSKGSRERVPSEATFTQADLTERDDVADVVTADLDAVFHLAAYTDTNYDDDRKLFEENTEMTYNLLEQMQAADIDKFAFTSSSTVYGEAPRPTPEDYAPLEPISIYGSSKLADEALISTYAHSYDIQSWVFRFANIVGPYQRGNVVPDFIEKLDDDPNELTILVMVARKSRICMFQSVSTRCSTSSRTPMTISISTTLGRKLPLLSQRLPTSSVTNSAPIPSMRIRAEIVVGRATCRKCGYRFRSLLLSVGSPLCRATRRSATEHKT